MVKWEGPGQDAGSREWERLSRGLAACLRGWHGQPFGGLENTKVQQDRQRGWQLLGTKAEGTMHASTLTTSKNIPSPHTPPAPSTPSLPADATPPPPYPPFPQTLQALSSCLERHGAQRVIIFCNKIEACRAVENYLKRHHGKQKQQQQSQQPPQQQSRERNWQQQQGQAQGQRDGRQQAAAAEAVAAGQQEMQVGHLWRRRCVLLGECWLAALLCFVGELMLV